ncbi:bifunctional Major facilitator superfamily/MFS transporter superfamily [Babesia duncani]|uniref:Bifunctional Major facilitator superfamily/MFS transporter superfamily n=1 Tax=Babesia duncani TaxID=323732 RepID=A0AAD9UNW6_9APIC|nr:bifunctional Major facilitator superfamily/MFS transporter superfamily [Babesia duncani]
MNRYLALGFFGFLSFSTGAIYWGWASVQEILYKAGAFEHVCEGVAETSMVDMNGRTVIDCVERKTVINSIFTVCYAIHFMFSFFGGLILDKFGPFRCFVMGHTMCAIAWSLILFFPTSTVCIWVGFVLIGLFIESCYQPMIVTLCDLFPNENSTVISIMGSLRSLSYFTPYIMSAAYKESFIPFDKLYIIGIVYLLIGNGFGVAGSYFFVPMKSLSASSTEPRSTSEEKIPLGTRIKTMFNNAVTLLAAAFKHKQMLEFLVLLVCGSLFLSAVEFITKASRDFLKTSDGSTAIELFKYTNVFTFLPAPFLGYVMDRVGPALIMNLLHSCGVLYFIFAAIDTYATKVMACFAYMIAGSLCMSSIYCYINERFSKQYFGTLVSCVFFCGGAFSLLNIPLYKTFGGGSVNELRTLIFIMIGYVLGSTSCTFILTYISKIYNPTPKRNG